MINSVSGISVVVPRPGSGFVIDYESRETGFLSFPREFLCRDAIGRKRTNFEDRCLTIRGVVLLAMNLL